MGIHRLPMAIPRLHMVTPLRSTGMVIPITDLRTIQATGTVVIMVEGAMVTVVMGIGEANNHDLRYDIRLKRLEMHKLFTDPKVDDATLLAKEKGGTRRLLVRRSDSRLNTSSSIDWTGDSFSAVRKMAA